MTIIRLTHLVNKTQRARDVGQVVEKEVMEAIKAQSCWNLQNQIKKAVGGACTHAEDKEFEDTCRVADLEMCKALADSIGADFNEFEMMSRPELNQHLDPEVELKSFTASLNKKHEDAVNISSKFALILSTQDKGTPVKIESKLLDKLESYLNLELEGADKSISFMLTFLESIGVRVL